MRRISLIHTATIAAFGLLVVPAAVSEPPPWMSEQAMRAEFIGQTIDGRFYYGSLWSAAFFADGRMDHYQHRVRKIAGRWFFRGAVFCSLPEPQYWHTSKIGCWSIVKVSANCYHYFRVRVRDDEPTDTASHEPGWYAMGWRRGELSTCEEKPSV